MVINKKGYALVEASLVIPLIVLIIFSLIMLTVHYYRSGEVQFENHEKAIDDSLKGTSLIDIRAFDDYRATNLGGILGKSKENYIEGSYYVINEVSILRVANEVESIFE